MERKEEYQPANNLGREAWLSADSGETIPEKMLDEINDSDTEHATETEEEDR